MNAASRSACAVGTIRKSLAVVLTCVLAACCSTARPGASAHLAGQAPVSAGNPPAGEEPAVSSPAQEQGGHSGPGVGGATNASETPAASLFRNGSTPDVLGRVTLR